MPHFAYVQDGVVQRVERIEAATMLDGDGVEQEALGQVFLASLYPGTAPGDFVLTHYPVGQGDVHPRGKYAGIGDEWDGAAFAAPAVVDLVQDAYERGKVDGSTELLQMQAMKADQVAGET